jgi:hypothetical protein
MHERNNHIGMLKVVKEIRVVRQCWKNNKVTNHMTAGNNKQLAI